jgi:hypothetical protein
VERTVSVLVVVIGLPWVVRVEATVCVALSVRVLSAWAIVLVKNDVDLITDVLRIKLGV